MRAIAWAALLSLSLSLTPRAIAANDDDEHFSRNELFTVVELTYPEYKLSSLRSVFHFPGDARSGDAFGVDVSSNNPGPIDWASLPDSGVAFVQLKASEGATFTDPALPEYLKALHPLHVPLGLYHFLSASKTASVQSSNFLAVLRDSGDLSLPPAVDLEWDLGPLTVTCPADARKKVRRQGNIIVRCDRWSTRTGDDIIRTSNAWIDEVRAATGREPLLYTNAYWWRERVGDPSRISELHTKRIWISDYGNGDLKVEKPQVPNNADWVLWQFTSSGHIGNSSTNFDVSIVRGGASRLSELLRD